MPPASVRRALALVDGVVVLDGGLSTELERRGHDLSGDLWSARLLRDGPRAVVEVHRSFLEAGARVLTTASYQAPQELLRLSVELARRAVDEWREGTGSDDAVWVAGSVGPYGAHLAGGQEYTGDYVDDVSAAGLAVWHRPRMEALADAGADLLALETVPAAAEALVLAEQAGALGAPAWLTLTTVTEHDVDGRERVLTRRGEDAGTVFAATRGVDSVVAVGVNCTEPGGVAAAVRVAAEASGKPVVVYPNSGETWDGAGRTWRGAPADGAFGDVGEWVAQGARMVGGCCRVGPEQVAALSRRLATAS